MRVIGKVLWWDKKDLNGIIIDVYGNEYYFDVSVVDGRKTNSLKPGLVLQFQVSKEIDQIPCADFVRVPPSKSKGRLEREFERNLQLNFSF